MSNLKKLAIGEIVNHKDSMLRNNCEVDVWIDGVKKRVLADLSKMPDNHPLFGLFVVSDEECHWIDPKEINGHVKSICDSFRDATDVAYKLMFI